MSEIEPQNILLMAHNQRVIISPFETEKLEFSYRPRGWVGGFSKHSKRRLLEFFYSFKESPFKTFWTLTFDKDVKSDYAKMEIKRIGCLLRPRQIEYLWVMEFTKKGRLHFHLALTDYLSLSWVTKKWGNGNCWVSEVFENSGLREYFIKEVSKGNQKRFMGFCGRWWGVSRALNRRYELGIYNEQLAHDLVELHGFKRNFYREDFLKLGLDLTRIVG